MTAPATSPPSEARAALFAGIACYLIWGITPLAFQQMGALGAGAWEIMAHRAAWGVLWAALLVVAARQSAQVMAVLGQPRLIGWLALSALCIGGNWTAFIFAVNDGRLLEAALGYYLNPLFNMAAGAWLFRERIDRGSGIAILLAGIGVAIQGFAIGHIPWVSLFIALCFAAYTVIRKRVPVDAQAGLLVECLLLTLPGIVWIVMIERAGTGHLSDSAAAFWLMTTGPITVVPLALFAWSARRMPLASIGFLQFLSPTLGFVLGAIQGEPLGWLRVVSFAFIWAGAVVFATNAVLSSRRAVPIEPGG